MSARELLRQSNYELYVFSLFLPARLRPGAWAVLALNAELASIPQKAHEPLARAMRLAWWREQLEALYAGAPPRRHDILLELAPYIARGEMPKREWDRLLEAYGRRMEGEAGGTTDGDTVAPWLHLLAALGGVYAEDYEAREVWGQKIAAGAFNKRDFLKKDMKKNINTTLCRLTYVLFSLRKNGLNRRENAGLAIIEPTPSGMFPLHFLRRVLLTKW